MIYKVTAKTGEREYKSHMTLQEKRVAEYAIINNKLETMLKSGRTLYFVQKDGARYKIMIQRAERHTIGADPKQTAHHLYFFHRG